MNARSAVGWIRRVLRRIVTSNFYVEVRLDRSHCDVFKVVAGCFF